jgi:hypothetical protein
MDESKVSGLEPKATAKTPLAQVIFEQDVAIVKLAELLAALHNVLSPLLRDRDVKEELAEAPQEAIGFSETVRQLQSQGMQLNSLQRRVRLLLETLEV